MECDHEVMRELKRAIPAFVIATGVLTIIASLPLLAASLSLDSITSETLQPVLPESVGVAKRFVDVPGAKEGCEQIKRVTAKYPAESAGARFFEITIALCSSGKFSPSAYQQSIQANYEFIKWIFRDANRLKGDKEKAVAAQLSTIKKVTLDANRNAEAFFNMSIGHGAIANAVAVVLTRDGKSVLVVTTDMDIEKYPNVLDHAMNLLMAIDRQLQKAAE